MTTGSKHGRRQLFSNTRDLVILQAANYVIPLFLLTYLTRVLGVGKFGVYGLGIAAAQFAFVFTDYGFSVSGAYVLSRRRANLPFCRRLIGSAIQIKAVVLVLWIISSTIIISWVPGLRSYSVYLFLVNVPIIIEAYVPYWIFQGLERFRLITVTTIVSRIIYLVSVILVVRTATLYWTIPFLIAVSHLIACSIGWANLLHDGYKPILPPSRFTKMVIGSGTSFFLSRLATATYGSVGSLFLGAASTSAEVAAFSAGQQLYRALQSVIGMGSQALYPYMVRQRDFRLLKAIILAAVSFGLVAVALLYLAGSGLVVVLLGERFASAYPVICVLVIGVIICSISVFMGYPFFGAIGRPDIANNTIIGAGIAQLIVLGVVYLSGHSTAIWVAASVVIAELFVLASRITFAAVYWKKAFPRKPSAQAL